MKSSQFVRGFIVACILAQSAFAAWPQIGFGTRLAIPAGESRTVEMDIEPGTASEMAISSECPDTGIYVYDEDGELIESNRFEGGEPMVAWTVESTGRYRIKVVNYSGSDVVYVLSYFWMGF